MWRRNYHWIECFLTPIIQSISKKQFESPRLPNGQTDDQIIVTIHITDENEFTNRWLIGDDN